MRDGPEWMDNIVRDVDCHVRVLNGKLVKMVLATDYDKVRSTVFGRDRVSKLEEKMSVEPQHKIGDRIGWNFHHANLDGVDLKQGEKLEVTFPSGAVRIIEVQLYNTSVFGSIASWESFHCSTWEGIPVRLPLFGLVARRVK